MRVAFSDESKRDLRSITIFISTDSPSRARTFVGDLQTACLGLADHPKRYALVPGFESRAYRRRPLGNYAIIYTVGANSITIVRVLHTAMDMDVALGSN